MISKKLIDRCKEIAYEDSIANGVPSLFQIDYCVDKAFFIAESLGANKDLVVCGAYLMDCMLGSAYKAGKLGEHVSISYEKGLAILNEFSEITENEKDTILHCISEHHGVIKYHSLESEICANSDCYKFLSVKGVIGGIKNMRDLELDALVSLYKNKFDEKLAILSLDFCKDDLSKELPLVREFLNGYK